MAWGELHGILELTSADISLKSEFLDSCPSAFWVSPFVVDTRRGRIRLSINLLRSPRSKEPSKFLPSGKGFQGCLRKSGFYIIQLTVSYLVAAKMHMPIHMHAYTYKYTRKHVHVCVCASHFSHVWLLATLWTVTRQAPLSLGFSSRLPCPLPTDLPDPGIEPTSLVSPALQADSLPTEPLGKPAYLHKHTHTHTYACARFAIDLRQVFSCHCRASGFMWEASVAWKREHIF